MSETIVALATPLGRSGIGLIRLSGESSLEITGKLVTDESFAPQPRRATLKKIYEVESGELIDEVIITYFQSPHSCTGNFSQITNCIMKTDQNNFFAHLLVK